jgi:ABC-type Fe3+ transport system substrate-binding protein
MGVLTFTKHPEAAKAFVDFCASEEGQAIAAQKGLASRSEGADA